MSVSITKEAHDFQAAAVMPDNTINPYFAFSEYVKGHMSVLFFYPLDFTFVCPSEIIALNNKLQEFEKRNVKVVVVSVDSEFTHLAYKKTPAAEGGIGNVQFPMVSDLTKEISKQYGVLHNNAVALRGTFIIDDLFVVRHESKNDLALGRNIDEILRLVDAVAFHKKNGDVCPANWKPGEDSMKPTAEGVAQYLKKHSPRL